MPVRLRRDSLEYDFDGHDAGTNGRVRSVRTAAEDCVVTDISVIVASDHSISEHISLLQTEGGLDICQRRHPKTALALASPYRLNKSGSKPASPRFGHCCIVCSSCSAIEFATLTA